jgi:rhamnosyltransferase
MPKILIILTTYNGSEFLQEQLNSIAKQTGVEWHLDVHDDCSTDQTIEMLEAFSVQYGNVRIIMHETQSGSAQVNFLRALRTLDSSPFDYVALSDQDDIWHTDKLVRSVAALESVEADGISSDVEAFWPDGRKSYVSKAQQQREFDHFFQSPGPGCTFVMKSGAMQEFSRFLQQSYTTDHALLHDHLIYWYWRENGYKWAILDQSTMQYRQHDNNAFGVNSGVRASLERIYRALFTPYFKDLLLALGTDTRRFRSISKWRELQRSAARSLITYIACLLH